MISAIICDHPYDRIFCILTCIFAYTVQQTNARAFYKRMNGIIDPFTNDLLLILALISCISLPLIGFFDEHQFKLIHGIVSIAFFISTGVYAILMAEQMNKHKISFPGLENEISRLLALKSTIISLVIVCAISALFGFYKGLLVPICEWSIVLVYINYFSLLSFASPYYDSVHPYGKLISKK